MNNEHFLGIQFMLDLFGAFFHALFRKTNGFTDNECI